jgi:hypothetical protein
MQYPRLTIGLTESRLLAQNAPNPERLQQQTGATEGGESYRYMSPEEIRAIDTARESRLADLRRREATSREEDQKQLPVIERQMQLA